MILTTTIVTDPSKLAEFEEDLKIFVEKVSGTPFALPAFLKESMKMFVSQQNQFPVILIAKVNGQIVGLVSLAIRQLCGIRFAQSLLDYWSASDLLLEDRYGQIATDHILGIIIKKLRCKYVMFYVPIESSYLQNLRQTCKHINLRFFLEFKHFINHGVVSAENSWNDFLKSRGRYFQKDLRAIERKLNNAGKWKMTLIENNIGCNNEIWYDKIMSVEKSSWKELTKNKGQITDENLIWFLEASDLALADNSILQRKTWFLELNDQPIAFSLLFEFKGTAFISKTSFVEKYRRLSPGIFVNNFAIKDLFDKREVKKIDFMSAASMVNMWDAKIVPRVSFYIGSQKIIIILRARPTIIRAFKKFACALGYSGKNYPLDYTAREQLQESTIRKVFMKILSFAL